MVFPVLGCGCEGRRNWGCARSHLLFPHLKHISLFEPCLSAYPREGVAISMGSKFHSGKSTGLILALKLERHQQNKDFVCMFCHHPKHSHTVLILFKANFITHSPSHGMLFKNLLCFRFAELFVTVKAKHKSSKSSHLSRIFPLRKVPFSFYLSPSLPTHPTPHPTPLPFLE